MKIYTFKAPDNTSVEILWPLRAKNRDQMYYKYIVESNYTEVDSIQDCDVAIYPHKVFNPETLVFDHLMFFAVKEAEKYHKPLILDATCDSDIFLDIPTAKILRCGLYKSLQKPFEIECPFWSNYRTKRLLDSLECKPKDRQPNVGFCGTISSIGKLSQLSKKFLPIKIGQSILSNGKFARKIDIRVKEGLSLKLREAAILKLLADKRINSCFDISDHRQTYYAKNEMNRLKLEKLFVENMSKCDYNLCIRGTGNYSGRIYMALNAGRIPILVDTDIVLPCEEKLHLIKVPVKSIDKIGDLVLEHFESTSDKDLEEMKAQNRYVFTQFLAPEKFLPNVLSSISPKKKDLINY